MGEKCKKCGAEIQEGSKYCNNCGTSIGSEDGKFNILNKFKYIKFILPLVVIIVIATVSIILYKNNPVVTYENDIKNNKLSEAATLYGDKIINNSHNNEKVISFLKSEVSSTKQKFIDKKISFDQANTKLTTISQTNLINNAQDTIDYISKLNNSRLDFAKGEEYNKNNDIENALKYYKEVIKEDSNYSIANTKINDLTAGYKTKVLKDAESSANNKDYQKAVDTLNTASQILTNDNDIEAKKQVYTTQLLDTLKNSQQVNIVSAGIVSETDNASNKILYPDMLQSVIKNNSSKTIKDMQVGWVGFDNNGYPLKIKTWMSVNDTNYEFIGNAKDINVIAGATFGSQNGWKLDENHGLSKVLACVKQVTYYDGTTWDNTYYKYWLDQYKDKQLK